MNYILRTILFVFWVFWNIHWRHWLLVFIQAKQLLFLIEAASAWSQNSWSSQWREKKKKRKKKAKALWSHRFNSGSLKLLVSNASWILFKFEEFSIASYSVREIPLIVESYCGIFIPSLANCNYSCALDIWRPAMNPLFMWFLKTKIFYPSQFFMKVFANWKCIF